MSDAYARLLALDQLKTDDSAEIDSIDTIRRSICECENALATFRSTAQMSGETADAIAEWLDEYSIKLQGVKETLEENLAMHNMARSAMARARERRINEAEGILMSASEYNEWARQPYVTINGECHTGASYAKALQDKLRTERNDIARSILEEMNSAVSEQATEMEKSTDPFTPGHESNSADAEGSTGTRSGTFGANTATAHSVASSASFNTNSLAAATIGGAVLTTRATTPLSGGTAPNWKRPPAGQPGSPSNPINDPEQLAHHDLLHTPVNQRMTPDGPTAGYLPRDPQALIDLRRQSSTAEWLNSTGPGSDHHRHSTAALGGMLGLGTSAGIGAAARSSVSGVSSLVTTTPGASALTSQVGGTGMLSMQQAAASTNLNGAHSPATNPRTGNAHTASQQAQSSRDRLGRPSILPSDTGRNERSEKKRSFGLIGYEVMRIDEETPSPDSPTHKAQEHGSAHELTPLSSQESDRW
ncbi:hypothetical protein HMPREF9004_1169 [Schaalia cardiffensis F0333]|uniref:Uncharacterized protein n=1 Tax=Schaalia cardiffensis F0333 TaxID=888050 RepID=N6XAG7_9ACTO|nr:hypothetical protein [Schaalia cardiffensis]ENO18138.1 hypothetical protein HMPREF9004_1169 [Schaalia cardiffensis F0333]